MKYQSAANTFSPFLMGILILLGMSCQRKQREEILVFEDIQKNVPVVADCDSVHCGEIKIMYPRLFSDSPLQTKINAKIEKTIAGLLLEDSHNTTIGLDEAIDTFRKSYDSLNQRFPDDIAPYEATVDVALLETLPNRLNFVIDSYVYTSGAHGYEKVTYLMIDPKTGEEVSFYDLLKNEENFILTVEEYFRQKFDIPSSASINSTGYMFKDETFALPEQCIILSKDIILTYNPYEIAPYSEDPIELHIPVDTVAHLLRD